MLKIVVPGQRLWDPKANNGEGEFYYTKEYNLTLEHSLVSISKWEAKWHKPFISDEKRSREQQIHYVECMTITQNVPKEIYYSLSKDNFKDISEYIDNKMTATWFSKPRKIPGMPDKPEKKEVITSELIYYWMVSLDIPFECQKWHLNRLLTLIKVCNIKNKAAEAKSNKGGKGSKVNNRAILSRNAELNAARRKALNSSG